MRLGNRLQHGQHFGQLFRLIARPVLLRGKADTRAIGTAAQVGLAEGARAVPCGCDHLSHAQVRGCDCRLHRVHVIARGTRRHRIHPDQVFGRGVGADVAVARAHVAVGQLEPCAGKGVGEVVGIGHELLADGVVCRIHLQAHVRIRHHRHHALGRVGRVNRHVLFLDADGAPLVCTGRGFGQFPLIAEQQVEIAHVPLRRVLGPCAFDAGGHGIGCSAVQVRVHPAKALILDPARFRLCAQQARIAVAMGLADGVATGGQRRGFLIVHRHAGEGDAHLLGGVFRVRHTVHAFGVHVDQAHMHGRQRRIERVGLLDVLVALGCIAHELILGAPVDVLLRVPDVFTAKGEAIGVQAHILIGDGARQQDQVGPAQLVAVLLLHRPQQAARLVEVAVIGPGVEGGKADVAACAATAPVHHPVRPGGVPGEADHQAAVMTPVCRPPVLTFVQQGLHIRLHGVEIQRLHFLTVVEVGAHRVCLAVMLVQDVQIQRGRPPAGDRGASRGLAAMHHGAFALGVDLVSVHLVNSLPYACGSLPRFFWNGSNKGAP